MSSSVITKIEQIIKREKRTPERQKKDDSKKSSSEILSELFGVFNADPPKIEEMSSKKSKKSKKKHKKEKKKRSRSNSSDSDDNDHSYKHKKRKKSKVKKRRASLSSLSTPPVTPPTTPDITNIKFEFEHIKKEGVKVKSENVVKTEPRENIPKQVFIKSEHSKNSLDASQIPMPDSPKGLPLDYSDLRFKLENKKQEAAAVDSEKGKGKIQIKNLKFSAVFEETVKQAEEQARKRAEKYEEGEYSDSSSSAEKIQSVNTQFPKSSDPGGILKKQAAEESKIHEDERSSSNRNKPTESSHKSSRKKSRDRSRTRKTSRRSRSHSASRRRYHKRSTSNSRHRSRSRRRSSSRSRTRIRHHSPRHRIHRTRSPTGVKLADSEKKRLLEVARRNAINMLKNGAVPAGAAALPPHTRNQVMAAIQSGGKSVDELTDFCKHLSKKEALGELSSVSDDDNMSENEDTLAFHHPFLVKEKAPIVMNIRGGAPLPIKNTTLAIANKDELRMQFPVSSGSQHREKATEWVPVTPAKKDMQVAKVSQKSSTKTSTTLAITEKPAMLALPAPPDSSSSSSSSYTKSFTTGNESSAVATLPAPGPQAYPPGVPTPQDVGLLVSEKLFAIRMEQEKVEMTSTCGFGWSTKDLGQFLGSTGAQILTPRELASGTQAWAKKDQLVRAAPVEGGMGMHLLQKMGWTPGQGLGKEGTGTLQPLLLEVKLDTRGLQAKEEMKPQRNAGRRSQLPLVAGNKHPVSLLGEYCSKHKLGPPEYNLCFECGPDHKKNFLFKVKVAGTEYQPAVASANKKQAKADSAQLALQKLGIVI